MKDKPAGSGVLEGTDPESTEVLGETVSTLEATTDMASRQGFGQQRNQGGRLAALPMAWYPLGPITQPARRRDLEFFGITRTQAVPPIQSGDELTLDCGATIAVRNGLYWACLQDYVDISIAPHNLEELEAAQMVAANEVEVRADFDQVVLGLVDPAHVPMVHTSWWWRKKHRTKKVRHYEPSDLGFTVRQQGRAYRSIYSMVGAGSELSIQFALPGLRIERIGPPGRRITNLTFVTPLRPGVQRLHNVIYSSIRGLGVLRPLLQMLGHRFLAQDAAVLNRIGSNSVHAAPMLFVGDPDQPSLWYFKLKRELYASRVERRAFDNPVRAATLQWQT
ncbi:hypothetical protein [Thalassobaculum litoreum]|uniref:Uncharacterized protein n=1 Tax=Thalassobaculum litoreum DSM 18839 TaxID=1123362 RepID=A0A8G2BMS6_9PROT|nr:hypothetical protein [Thalassobaculum litoreum]SDG59421.1 hypothetical protein SAMN05660686_04966 [Thalassobaculum litoreum DSM 18839]